MKILSLKEKNQVKTEICCKNVDFKGNLDVVTS